MSLRLMTDAILSALLAPPCAACSAVLNRPLCGAVCERCWASIVPHQERFGLDTVSFARAIGSYEGRLRDVLHALKYDGRRSIAPRLSAMMATHGSEVLAGADYVVPVPLHRRRRRERGFNQAEDLARGLGLPVLKALRRVRSTQPQVDLPAEQRRKNVHDAFELRAITWFTFRTSRGFTRDRSGSAGPPVIVLVDDVATTGATLEACARVLKAAGVAEVRALTAARVASGRR